MREVPSTFLKHCIEGDNAFFKNVEVITLTISRLNLRAHGTCCVLWILWILWNSG